MAIERVEMEPETDDGFTLLEVLLTVFLMSTAFLVVLGALFTTITAADTHRRISTSQAVVRDLAEYVKSQNYLECTGTNWPTYDISGFSAPPGYTPSIYFVPAIWNGDNPATFTPPHLDDPQPPTCPAQDLGVQRITVQVTTVKHVTEKLTVLKRRQP